MSILQIAGVALVSAFAVGILKIYKSDLVVPVTILATVILLGAAVALMVPVTDYISDMSAMSGFSVYFKAIMKALGISIIADTAASVCRESGQSSVASKVEFAAKIMILSLALPIIKEVVSMALEVVK